MAIYHLTASTGSKASGASARDKNAYDQREQRYADREDCQHREAGNMPEWAAHEPSQYWQAADDHERANGRLYKSLEFSLPRELDRSQQIELAHDFAEHLTHEERLPYSLAIHDEGKGNPHVHMMISERQNDGHDRSAETWFKRANKKDPERGGAVKTESLKPKEWLQQTREDWQKQANRALERAGHEQRIDHRSLEDQGITDRLPQVHVGPNIEAMEAKGIKTHRMDEYRARLEVNDRLASLAQAHAALGPQINAAESRLQAAKEAGQAERAGQTIDTSTSVQDARHERDHKGTDASPARGARPDHERATEPAGEERGAGPAAQEAGAEDRGHARESGRGVAEGPQRGDAQPETDIGQLWRQLRTSSGRSAERAGVADAQDHGVEPAFNRDIHGPAGAHNPVVDHKQHEPERDDMARHNGQDIDEREAVRQPEAGGLQRRAGLEDRRADTGLQGAAGSAGQEWEGDTRPLKPKHEREAREQGASYMEGIRKRWEASKEWMSNVSQRMGLERLREAIQAYREGKASERTAALREASSAADLGGYAQGVKDIQDMPTKVNETEADKRRALGAVEQGKAKTEKQFYRIEKHVEQTISQDRAKAFDKAEQRLQSEQWPTDMGRRMALDKLNEAREADDPSTQRNAINEIRGLEDTFGPDNSRHADELSHDLEQAERGDWRGAQRDVEQNDRQARMQAKLDRAAEKEHAAQQSHDRGHGMSM